MRCNRLALVALAALFTATTASRAVAEEADPCLTNKCRAANASVIFTDVDGSKKQAPATKLAYTNVEKGAITVTLGETLTFSAESDGKRLSNVAFVSAAKAANADPAPLAATVKKGPGEIVLKFTQPKDPASHSRLVVTHNFEGTLVFDAYILPFPFGPGGYKQSPSCPVAPGNAVSTTWYTPVLVATLAGFKLVDKAKPNTSSEIICQ